MLSRRPLKRLKRGVRGVRAGEVQDGPQISAAVCREEMEWHLVQNLGDELAVLEHESLVFEVRRVALRHGLEES